MLLQSVPSRIASTGRAFCVEVEQIATGVLPSQWLLSIVVVFLLVTA